MRPNLDDPAARVAYKSELRGLARAPRWIGFALVALGAGGLIYAQTRGIAIGPLRPFAWAAIAVGWLNMIAAIVYRTRYHKARMAGDQALGHRPAARRRISDARPERIRLPESWNII